MKNIRLNALVFVIVALMFATCENNKEKENGDKGEDTLSVIPIVLEFDAVDKEIKTVEVETNVKDWSVSQSVVWLKIAKDADANNFTVAVEKNNTLFERNGTITVKAGKADPVTVTVEQRKGEGEPPPPPTLSATPTDLVFGDNDSERKTVTVTTNLDKWNISKSDGWINFDKENTQFSVWVERNLGAERVGTITLTADEVEPVTITVTQSAYVSNWATDPNLQVLKAFPGAEGFGAATTGGRGGKVIYVTNLNDSGEGSLRWAINQTGARTVMFKVSGNIKLNSRLSIKNGNLTIAGHTAPGDGICLSGYDVTVDASNVIIRYMRFRMGDLNNVQQDAIWGRYQNNVILDHCSMSWSVDECASFYENQDFTMQWCLISESMRISKHDKGAHGYGGIWGGMRASFHHNLLAHHDSRNPRFAAYSANRAQGLVDFRNNVIYNWGGNSGYGGEGGNYNVVNNYYQPTQASGNRTRIVNPDADRDTGIHGVWYVHGNVMMNPDGTVNTTITNNNRQGVTGSVAANPASISNTEFDKGDITTHTAQEAYQLVLADVGASFKRDAIDTRVINEVRNRLTLKRASGNGGTRDGLIDSQDDVGGWCELVSLSAPTDTDDDGIPDEWETANGLNPNYQSDGAEKTLSGGTYTNLEVYLYDLLIRM